MDTEKYNRSVSLQCPTCGGDQFAYEGEGEDMTHAKCASCGLELTRDELIEANTENISEHVEEVKKAVIGDFEKEIHDMFRKAFQGNKSIRFK